MARKPIRIGLTVPLPGAPIGSGPPFITFDVIDLTPEEPPPIEPPVEPPVLDPIPIVLSGSLQLSASVSIIVDSVVPAPAVVELNASLALAADIRHVVQASLSLNGALSLSAQVDVVAAATLQVNAALALSADVRVQSTVPANNDYQRRVALGDIGFATDFATAGEVDDYAHRTGTYLANPTWLQHVTAAHPTYGSLVPAGNTGIMLFLIKAQSGEPDFRNLQPWNAATVYSTDSPAVTWTNGNNYSYINAAPSSGHLPSETAYWNNHGTQTTSSDNPHVTWIRRYSSIWGTHDGLPDNQDLWIVYRMAVDEYYANSRWEYNTGNGANKWHIMCYWHRANPDTGQIVFGHISHYDHMTGFYRDQNGNENHNAEGVNLSQGGGLGSSELSWQPAIGSRYNSGNPSTATQLRRRPRRWAIEHPAGLDPQDSAATPAELDRRATGGIYSQRDVGQPGGTQPYASDPQSGGVKVRRDVAVPGRYVDVVEHIKLGVLGTNSSVRETWVSWNGRPFDYDCLWSRNDLNIRQDNASYQPGTISTAYPNPGTMTAPPGGWRQSGIHILPGQRTAQIKNTHFHPAGTHLDSTISYHHMITTFRSEGFPPAGKTLPVSSRAVRPAYLPTGAFVRKRLSVVGGGFPTLESVIPAEWRGNVAFTGATTYDGRHLPGFSGRIWHPYLPRSWGHRRGGHAQTHNNMTEGYNFNGTNMPMGYYYEDGSTVAAIEATIQARIAAGEHSGPSSDPDLAYQAQSPPIINDDGRGVSVHSYAGQCILPDERLVQFGGSANQRGSSTNRLITYQLGSRSGSGYSVYTGGFGGIGFGEGLAYSFRYNVVLIWSADQGWASLWDPDGLGFPISNQSISAVDNEGNGPGYVFDHTRDQFRSLGRRSSGNPHRIVEISRTSGTLTLTTSTPTYTGGGGANDLDWLNANAPAAVMDEWNDRIWIADLSAPESGDNPDYGRYVWELNPVTNVSVRRTVTGDPVDVGGVGGLSWSRLPRLGHHRMGLLPYWNCLAFEGRASDGMYAISIA